MLRQSVAGLSPRRPHFDRTSFMWWTNWHYGKFSQSTLVSPATSYFSNCSINMYNTGLVQLAQCCLADWVSPHATERETLLLSSPLFTVLKLPLYDSVAHCRRILNIVFCRSFTTPQASAPPPLPKWCSGRRAELMIMILMSITAAGRQRNFESELEISEQRL
jgi:hypothetical protein